jgi:hypothetical protein
VIVARHSLNKPTPLETPGKPSFGVEIKSELNAEELEKSLKKFQQ